MGFAGQQEGEGPAKPLYDLLREGHVAAVSPDVVRLTGRAPERLRTQLARDFG